MDYLRVYMDVLNKDSDEAVCDNNFIQLSFVNKQPVNFVQNTESNEISNKENPDLLLKEFKENIEKIDEFGKDFEFLNFDEEVKETVQMVSSKLYSKSNVPFENLTPFQEKILFYVKRNLEIQDILKKKNTEEVITNRHYDYVESKKRSIFNLEEVDNKELYDKKKENKSGKEIDNFKDNLKYIKESDRDLINAKF